MLQISKFQKFSTKCIYVYKNMYDAYIINNFIFLSVISGMARPIVTGPSLADSWWIRINLGNKYTLD